MNHQTAHIVISFCLALSSTALAQQPAPAAERANPDQSSANYILGPEDQITIQAPEVEDINKPYRIDMRGNINPPLVGRLRAAGLTVEALEKEIVARLKQFYKDPHVSITVSEFHSQPVSVLGAVTTPGVYQVQGRKTLFEVLSQAGGLRQDAGNRIKIARRKQWGPIPLPNQTTDSTGDFTTAELAVKSVMDAKNPAENILIEPNDVISVPKADLIYVVGSVRKSGGFVLGENESISVLQAISLAEGMDRTAAPKNAKVLRPNRTSGTRTEILVDLSKVMAGKGEDIALQANDILFVPNSAPRSAALRTFEAAVQIGTGLAVYRR